MLLSAIFIHGCALINAGGEFINAEGEYSKALKSFKADQYDEAYRYISAADREFPSNIKYRYASSY